MNTKSKLPRYRNSEFIQFMKDTVKIYKAYDLKTLKLQTLVADVEGSITKLESVFTIARKNGNTELLENADARRDRAIIGIRTLVEAYVSHFDPSLANAAKALLILIDKYGGGIANFNYIDETNTISNIVKEMQTEPKAMAAASTLKIDDWVAELGAANTIFNNLFIERNKDISELPEQNLGALRTPALQQYEVLVEKTAAHFSITAIPEYKAILDQIEAIIVKYNSGVPKAIKKPSTPKPPPPPEAK
jgi:hypothetical protein